MSVKDRGRRGSMTERKGGKQGEAVKTRMEEVGLSYGLLSRAAAAEDWEARGTREQGDEVV